MMAKMFYTLDETKAALGKNEEEIKQYAREGRLREFRDGPRLMFKADQVEALKNELGGGGGGMRDQIDLGPSDTGAPIGLVDSRSSTGTGSGLAISLADSQGSPGSSGMGLKDDTALAADLGLSGSLGGVPSPGRPGSSSSGLTGSRSGISVLTDSEAAADPSAATAINANVTDQVSLEGVGSGSGLLDLTRESDDTSLGAELLDEIQPGGSSRRGVTVEPAAGSGTAMVAAAAASAKRAPGGGVVVQMEKSDPLAPAFGAACLAACAMLLLGTVAICSAVLGTRPGLLEMVQKTNFLTLSLGGLAAAVVFFMIGLFIGKATK
ncbi:MAG: hypothetical protein ACREJC_03480 [Tepidisphaeraceae bacterium]